MNRNKLILVALGLQIASIAGCELIVDFDRTKIDGGPLDGTTQDVVTPDVSIDQGTKDVVNDVVTTPDASDGSTTDASDGSTTDASDSSTVDADDGSTADASDGATE